MICSSFYRISTLAFISAKLQARHWLMALQVEILQRGLQRQAQSFGTGSLLSTASVGYQQQSASQPQVRPNMRAKLVFRQIDAVCFSLIWILFWLAWNSLCTKNRRAFNTRASLSTSNLHSSNNGSSSHHRYLNNNTTCSSSIFNSSPTIPCSSNSISNSSPSHFSNSSMPIIRSSTWALKAISCSNSSSNISFTNLLSVARSQAQVSLSIWMFT